MSNCWINILNESEYLFTSQRAHLHHSDFAFQYLLKAVHSLHKCRNSVSPYRCNTWELVNRRSSTPFFIFLMTCGHMLSFDRSSLVVFYR